ncbi:MAG TPA: hypothetical protein VL918_14595, partial [Sphingobium sp.]|nr:hypothetical protein [Sphingobium sp.]
MADKTPEAGSDPVTKAADKAREMVNATKARAGEVAADARDGAYRAADKANTLLTEHPLAAAAAAAAAGAMIGLFLPRWSATARIGATMGATVGTTARRAAKAIATAETAKTLLASLNAAGNSVRTSAHRLP